MKHFLTILLFSFTFGFSQIDNINEKINMLSFNGEDDYVDLNNVSSQLAGQSNFTIEFWMRAKTEDQTNSIRTNMFSINPMTSNGNGLLLIIGGTYSQQGKFMVYDEGSWGANYDVMSSQEIGDDLCHHIAYVRTGNIGKAYVDGELVGQHYTTYSIQSTDRVSLGQDWDDLTTVPKTSDFYNGSLYGIKIWQLARSQNEIVDGMNQELSGNESGLVAYYNCNQGIGGEDNSGIQYLVDASDNAFNESLSEFNMQGEVSNFVERDCGSGPDLVSDNSPKKLEGIEVSVFPNPSNGLINLKYDFQKVNKIQLVDLSGQFIKEFKVGESTIDITNLESGTYYLIFSNEENKLVKKIILN